MIPNIIHFVFGLKKDFGGHEFSFTQYLAVVTASATNKPDCLYFHYQYEPTGFWWECAKPYLTLKLIEAPDSIFGNPLDHVAHKADIVRLEQLIEHGGIYLDMDVVCINSLQPLLNKQCVMARQPEGGLCNAIILAEPNASFLQQWYNRYQDFDQREWDEHSVQLPLRLAGSNPELLTVLGPFAFFFPFYSDPPHTLWMTQATALSQPLVRAALARRIKRHISKLARCKRLKSFYPPLRHYLKTEKGHLRQLRRSYCIHLWQQAWWEPYLQHLSPLYLVESRTNFARLIRHTLNDTPAWEAITTLAEEQRLSDL